MASPNYINKGLLTDIENTRDKIGRLKNQLLTRSTSETTESLAKILETYINMLNDLGYTYDSLSQGGKPYTRKYAHANPLTANNSSYDESVSSVDDNTVMNDVPWNTIFDAIKNAKENFWKTIGDLLSKGAFLIPIALNAIEEYKKAPDYGYNTKAYTELSDEEKKDHLYKITEYEKSHPDEAKTLNELFSNCPEKYRNDINEIKYMLYNSKGDCHDLFFKYIDGMNIVTYDSSDGIYFSSDSDPNVFGLHLNMEDMRKHQFGYGVFVHESGHYIDYLLGKKINEDNLLTHKNYSGGRINLSNIYRNDENVNATNSPLHDIMYSETEKTVTCVVDDYSKNVKELNPGQRDFVIKVLMGREGETNMIDSDSDDAYIKCLDDITGYLKDKNTIEDSYHERGFLNSDTVGIIEYNQHKNSGLVKEVFSGCTNGSLLAELKSSNETNGIDGAAGAHQTWAVKKDSEGNIIRDENGNEIYQKRPYYYYKNGSSSGGVETEFVAEYFRVNMTGSKKEEAYTRMYLNDSWNEVGKLLSEADQIIDESNNEYFKISYE